MPVKRLPLLAAEATRDGSLAIDAHGVNMIVEKDSNGMMWSFKRPGMSGPVSTYTSTTGISIQSTPAGPLYIYQNAGVTYAQVGSVTQVLANFSYYIGGDNYAEASSTAPPKFYFLYATTTAGTYQAYTVDISSGTPVFTTDTAPTGTGPLIPGVVQLDGTFYVMDQYGGVWGSDVNSTATWDAGNLIYANAYAGTAVKLAKQLTYVVAFTSSYTEFFYDAANTAGSPLSPVPAQRIQYGAFSANSIAQMDNSLFWVAQGNGGELFVVTMENIQPKRISTPEVERILATNSVTSLYGTTLKIMGHTLYLLTIDSTVTLVFDANIGAWSQWQLPKQPISGAIPNNNQSELMFADGQVYTFVQLENTELGQAITWELVTPPFDGGSRTRKYMPRMDILTDNTPAQGLQVRWSDDDQVTWSNWRSVNLQSTRPTLTNCGTFRRRTFQFRHAGPQALRLQAVDLFIEEGTL